jgi:Family of unknown function (DUF5309)
MALPTMSAAPTNTYIETTAPNVKEDLADIIYQTDPTETPMVSLCTVSGADQVTTEWLVQELYPAANVPQPEGFTAAMSPAKKPARLNNVAQILARTVAVSDTLRVVDQVGDEEFNRQIVLRGMEIKRDLELTLTGESIKTVADPRQLSGFQTWCSNGSVGAGTGAFPVGDGTNGHTAGTLRDLTLNLVEDAIQASWNSGGKVTTALMSASIKRWFSTMAAGGTGNPTVAQNIVQATTPQPVTIVGAVGVFLSDFGPVDLVPDRYMPAHVLELVDPNFIELAPLPQRDFIEEDYAKTGDNTQGGVVWEGTLRPTAPKAHACVWDLNQ